MFTYDPLLVVMPACDAANVTWSPWRRDDVTKCPDDVIKSPTTWRVFHQSLPTHPFVVRTKISPVIYSFSNIAFLPYFCSHVI